MRWKIISGLPSVRRPQWLVVVPFVVAILVGAALLSLPFARTGGLGGRWTVPLFLSASATCITGLTPVDIATYLTPFGQLVLLALVQLGGLGIMTLGTFMLEMMGGRLGIRSEQALMNTLGVMSVGRVRGILANTVVFTLFWELAGAVLLGWRFHSHYGYGAAKAAYHGIFHSVSAFCNAGFSLYPGNVTRFAGDPVILLTLATLIVIGGLGFIVLANIAQLRFWRRNHLERGRLNLHTKIVLWGTATLLVAGTLGVYVLERHQTLAQLGFGNRWLGAFFHSVSCRTAGFSGVDIAAMRGVTKAFSMALMFIGGAPGSTAGGIKVTTAVVLAATVLALMRNRENSEFGKRAIPVRAVRESIVITVLSLTLTGVMAFILHLTENVTGTSLSTELCFETVAAFTTVGFSENVTPALSHAGLLCMAVCMFVGRLGPLTIALTMRHSNIKAFRSYPEEPVVVG